MPFPKTQRELKAAGYVFSNDAACKGCGADIEWWTTPTNRKIPMDPMPSDSSQAVSHWATCPEQAAFR